MVLRWISTLISGRREAVRAAAAEVLGQPAPEVGVQYWMDAAIFDAAGIPTVCFGATGAGAHEADEWVSLNSMRQSAQVLVRAVRKLCGECVRGP